MDEVFVYESDKGIVRIHTGKRTEKERKEALENACREFYWAIEKKHPGYFDSLAVYRQ